MKHIEAYKIVNDSDDPYRAYRFINKLEKKGLIINDYWLRFLVDEEYFNAVKKNTQQIVIRSWRRSILTPLTQYSAGYQDRLAYPLPKQWLDLLIQEGVPVCLPKSRNAFFRQQIRGWGRSVNIFISKLGCSFKSYQENVDSYQMYPEVPEHVNNIQSPYSFISWLKKNDRWDGVEKVYFTSRYDIGNVSHSKTLAAKYIFPRLGVKERFSFSLECAWIYLKGFFLWICGQWYVPNLMPELINFAYFKRIQNPARVYGFNNSVCALRPLWTYFAENKGIEIFLYFYSSNGNFFYIGQKKPAPTAAGYLSMSWPKYWALTQDHKNFLTKQCNVSSEIDICGVIDFVDNPSIKIPQTSKPVLALFDIPVYDTSYLASIALTCPIYTPEMMEKFIDDVIAVAKAANYQILWKTKKDISKSRINSDYQAILKKYDDDIDVFFVDPTVSARRVVKAADACVSMVFTTVAYIALEEGKPSIYYDPSEKLKFYENLSHGIDVLGGTENLISWLNKQKK